MNTKLEATTEQRDFARAFLQQGSIGNRGSFDGDNTQQLFGLIGQVIICDLLNIERPKNTQGFDGGHDIYWLDKKWDVKVLIGSVDWKPGKHVQNVHGRQVKYDCDGYVFLHYNKSEGVYTVCGYISKHDFLNNAMFYGEGAARPRSDGSSMIVKAGGMYEIKGSKLKQFKEEELHGSASWRRV